MEENSKNKNWNQQFKEWYNQNYKGRGKGQISFAKELGVGKTTIGDYLSGRITNLSLINPEVRERLYQITNLEFFKSDKTPKIPLRETGYSEKNKGDKEKDVSENERDISGEVRNIYGKLIEKIITEAGSLTRLQRLEAGLTKAKLYSPTVDQRVDAVMETIDILAEAVDYFRTAPKDEQKILIERLKDEPETFSYVNQILNVLYKDEGINHWILMMQPPSKIKDVLKKK